MKHNLVSTFLLLFLQCIGILAQGPSPSPTPTPPPSRATAPAPGPPGPTNVTKILEKAGQCSTFIRLLQTTQEISQITSLLNNSNSITIFVPPDNAFLSMKEGTLNSLNDQQKSELIKFHVLPQYFSLSQFQTASNPMQTQAGGTSNREFPINITTNGTSVNITTGTSVNITTGIVNASISNTIYIDSQLAIYQVDKVLLPLQFFVPPAPTPAPSPPNPKNNDDSLDSDSVSSVSSGVINSPRELLFFLAVFCFVYMS
ncbi:fasciclin-like arabinogalactan protein 12 [Solanum pennellii]|uniref:Fasciclin-like arabinogalactan protein 12 n=1 Tax=Solanum pennellii TaxID=28526 RepID=A0ABM1HLU4_SOLPN|nr:fasciclin-like arabinogalactan protein 12 [Solanum pennellii]